MNEELINKIISVAYGDAGFIDTIKIYRLAKIDPDVKKLLEGYKSTAEQVHSLKEEELPDELLAEVEKRTVNEKIKINSFAADLYSIIFLRPVISAAAVVVLVGTILFGIITNRTIEYKYTPQQVSTADMQVQKALSIVGKIFDQTGATLREDVLNSRVAKPIRESMGVVNDFFNNENKYNTGEIQ